MQYSGGWRRFIALLIDVVILAIIFYILGKIMGTSSTSSGSVNVSLSGGPALLAIVIEFGYFIVLEAMFGATVGKMAMGLKVTQADGSKLGWGGAFVRNILRIVDGFPYFIPYLLGAIVMWTSDKKQRIGDKAAGTVVLRKSDVAERNPVSVG